MYRTISIINKMRQYEVKSKAMPCSHCFGSAFIEPGNGFNALFVQSFLALSL